MNKDELKTIKTAFEAELNRDKIYHQTERSISKLIREIPSELKTIAHHDSDQKAHFSSRINTFNDEYQSNVSNFDKAIKLINTKNETELKNIKRKKNYQLDKITKRFNQQIDTLNQRREQVESEYNQKLKEIETTLQRDLGSYRKVSQNARKLNQKVTLEIEKEQQEALKGLKNIFDNSTKQRDLKRQSFIEDYGQRKKEIDSRQQDSTTNNNNVYISIKTNYNEFSMIFNKKINTLNKENQNALKTIKERYEAKREPINQLLIKLKDDYNRAIEHLKLSHQEELIKMNEDFKDKKQQYEEKKARIIHESNEIVSLLNSKLTAYKEAVNRDNLESSRQLRSEIKSTDDEHKQVDLQKEIRANLKNANNELNKQIIRTNKEISVKQREFHYRLYNHDLAYLKLINDWRLLKTLTNYRYKQSIAKIDLNFNHNISQSKAQLALNEAIYKHQEQLLNLSLNRDLLSLETQLQLGSIIQERELNLLTNDQQTALNITKLEHAQLDIDHQLALEELDFLQKKDELSYEYNKLTVSSNTQLELEKARSRRDFSLEEQDIRGEIAKKIYERSEHNLDHEKKLSLLEIDHEMKTIEMTQDNDAFHIDSSYRNLAHKRMSFMMKASIKNLKRSSIANVNRVRKIDHEELLDYHYHITQFLSYLLHLHDKRISMRKLIHDLYLAPSHPETFKQSLQLAIRFDHEIDLAMHEYIHTFENRSREVFKLKIDNQKDYRSLLKHDEILKFYTAKTKRLDREQKVIESEIQHIEQNYIKFQSDIDQNKSFIAQLIKINDQIKSGLLPLQTSYDYRENIKLIKNHQKVIAHLKDNMKRSDRLINIKHKEINALAKEQTSVQRSIENETKKLTREKENESQFYLRHLVKLDKHYKVLSKKLSLFTHHSLSFYSDLKDLVYVTNDALQSAFKKLRTHRMQFERQLIVAEQHLLRDTLAYFQECQHIEDNHAVVIANKTAKYINEINDNIITFNHDQDNALKLQTTMLLKQNRAMSRDEIHQRDILHLNKEKTTHVDLHDIKQLEEKLDAHLVHSESELNALNENQRAIALQYVKEAEQKLDIHYKEHQKHINFFKSRFANTSNDLESTNATLLNKNQVLLSRYVAQYAKTVENMKSKLAHYNSQIDHHLLDIKKATELHHKDAALKDKRRLDELNNIKNHLHRFEQQAESAQKGTLSKETLALKRNLNFKIKALKLN